MDIIKQAADIQTSSAQTYAIAELLFSTKPEALTKDQIDLMYDYSQEVMATMQELQRTLENVNK